MKKRRGRKKKDSNHSGKIECPHLLRRAAINKIETTAAKYNGLPITVGGIMIDAPSVILSSSLARHSGGNNALPGPTMGQHVLLRRPTVSDIIFCGRSSSITDLADVGFCVGRIRDEEWTSWSDVRRTL